jgi:hypothetical protein
VQYEDLLIGIADFLTRLPINESVMTERRRLSRRGHRIRHTTHAFKRQSSSYVVRIYYIGKHFQLYEASAFYSFSLPLAA